MTQSPWYLGILLAVIAVIVAIAVPSLFWKRCPSCRRRNALDAPVCKSCGAAFPRDPD